MTDIWWGINKVKVFFGNQSDILLEKNIAYYSIKKYIFVKCHFVRHVIDESGVLLEKVHTQNNCADMFTKLVTLEKMWWCLDSLGLQEGDE